MLARKGNGYLTILPAVTRRLSSVGLSFRFFAYGILAIAALALFLNFVSVWQQVATGSELWATFGSGMSAIVMTIVVLFFIYMFAKLLISGLRR